MANHEKSNSHIITILQMFAPDMGIDVDSITVITNKKLSGVSVSRYEFEGIEKFMLVLGREVVELMEEKKVKEFVGEIKRALSMFKTAKYMEIKTPIVTVRDTDFTYEYVLRATHVSGMVLTRVSNSFEVLSMKQSIHEECAEIIGTLAQGVK